MSGKKKNRTAAGWLGKGAKWLASIREALPKPAEQSIDEQAVIQKILQERQARMAKRNERWQRREARKQLDPASVVLHKKEVEHG